MAEKKENRIQTAIRELDLDPRDVKLASSMLQVLTASRKAKRQSKYGEGTPTLAEFFEFALPRTKDAQGQLMQDLWVQFELGEIN
ncbi:MAG: hypothetical protein AAF503_12960, partial [Pseudomonadota bacterium]